MNSPQSVQQLAKETAKTLRTKKPITLVKEEVTLADGRSLPPLPVNNSSDVLRVSLLMLFKHISDIHVGLVEIIADKFGLSIEDIHKAIQEDPRWTKMLEHPLITDLTATIDQNAAPPQKPKKTKKTKVVVPVQKEDDDVLVFNTEDDVLVFE